MTKVLTVAVALLLALSSATPLHAVPQLVSYQGRISVGNTNFNGTGKFKFALVITTGVITQWSNDDTSTSGSEPTTAVSLPVVNGFYSVLLGDTTVPNMTKGVPPSAFNFSSDIRLRVWFSDGVNGFQRLDPDQRIAAAPWAMVASAVPMGAITSNELANGAVTFGKIANNTISAAQIAPAAGITGSQLAANTIGAGQILNGAITGAKLSNNVQFTDKIAFGAQTRQMIDLYNSIYGIGVQADTLYQRSSGGNFAWFHGGVHSDNAFDPGTGGLNTMRLNPDGELHVGGVDAGFSLQNRETATFVGNPTLGERWEAYVDGGIYRLWSGGDKLTLDKTGHVTAASLATGTTGANVAIGAFNGSGGASPDVRTAVYGESTEPGGNGVIGVANNGASAYGIWGRSTSGYAGKFDGKVLVNGAVSVRVLTITGGADVAEPFEFSRDDIPLGSVVVIDENNPGHLTMSSEPYDKRVAGIISGANGVQAGLRLHQAGVLEGAQHVALSGRVYVQADAGSGAIRPGDLLTTSDVPGRAMKAGDHARAQGAIIGKAMTPLAQGEGMVLVLVTLQ